MKGDSDAIKRAQNTELPLDFFEDAERSRIILTLSRYSDGVRHASALNQVDRGDGESLEDEVKRARKLVSAMRLISDRDVTLKGESLKALRGTVEVPWYLLLSGESNLEGCAALLDMRPHELAQWIACELDPPNSRVFLKLADALKVKLENSEARQRSIAQHTDASIKSAEKRRKLPKNISDKARELLATGTEQHEVAGKLARRYGVTTQAVGKALLKEKKMQEEEKRNQRR